MSTQHDTRLRRFIPEFAAPETERAYRAWNLPDATTGARTVLAVGTVLALLPIASDYLILGLGAPFYLILAIRLISWCIGLRLLIAFRQPTSPAAMDSGLLLWMASVLIVSAVASATRPSGFLLHVLIQQSVLFAAYIFVPLRYWHRVACGVGGAAGYLLLQWTVHPITAGEMMPLLTAMVFVNAIGATTAYQLERLRRLDYARLQDLHTANAFLEEEQRALRAAKQEAENANLAKSRFLAAASHDLRQPVHALGMFVGALRAHEMDAEARKLVEHIDGSVHAMDGLFSSLLDISRLDAGVIQPRVETFAVHALLERICSDYSQEAAGKGVRLVLRRCSESISSDPVLLERVVRNLVCNAIRYCDRGRVLVGCRRPTKTGSLRIQVLDTGHGIAAEHQESIFQEFYQIGNPERDREKGLGLGLAIVRRLTSLLGHPLTLRSQPGRGSLFSVEVPVAEARAAANAADALRRIEFSSGLVLVVDDEIAIQDAMKRLLRSWGLANITAGSCNEMLEHIADCPSRPDLIVCDYRLREGERGTDVIQRLQAEYNEDIPGILITGDTAPDRLREAEESGFVLLHKPVSNGRLRAAINSAMNARPVAG